MSEFIISSILSTLIVNSLEFRDEHKDIKLFQPDFKKSYLKEYCTISLQSHRRSGHTTAIIENIEKFQNPLVIAMNLRMVERITNQIREQSYPTNIKFASFYTFENEIRGSLPCDGIFVDTASLMSKEKKETLYDVLTPFLPLMKNKLTIIFLE